MRDGDLSRFHVIILPEQLPETILRGHAAGTMPEGYTGGIGDQGAERLRRWVLGGGTLVAVDAAADFAIDLLGLPVKNATADVPPTELFVPATILALDTDPEHPLAYGMPTHTAAFFVRGRAFSVGWGSGARVVATYCAGEPLLSGWALGAREHLAGKPAVVEVPAGKGRVVLIGFRPVFRGQPRTTFKVLLNAVQDAAARGR
jgi:hypothetical protein